MIETHPLVVEPPHATLWRRSDRRAQAFRPSVHAELVMFHGIEGQADYFIDGQILKLRAGTVLFAWAGTAHFLLSDSPGFDMWVGLISHRFADGRSGVPPVDLKDVAEARQVGPEAHRELQQVSQAALATEDQSVRAVGLQWWVARCWAHWQAALSETGARVHPAVDRAARLLREHPDLPIREVAKEAGLSPGRLGQVFQNQMGESLVSFRTEAKLQAADVLVQRDGADLLSAALDSGFGSYSQFYRAFRDKRGQGPREWYKTT